MLESPFETANSTPYKAVDMFSGVGGLTLGARIAGVNVIFGVENDHEAGRAYKANNPAAELISESAEFVDYRKFQAIENLMLIGGPPCRAFSTSNQRNRGSKHPDVGLYKTFLKAAKTIRPVAIVFENVPGIVQTEGAKFLNEVTTTLEDLDYEVRKIELCASNFGVPQKRRRLFIIAARNLPNTVKRTPPARNHPRPRGRGRWIEGPRLRPFGSPSRAIPVAAALPPAPRHHPTPSPPPLNSLRSQARNGRRPASQETPLWAAVAPPVIPRKGGEAVENNL